MKNPRKCFCTTEQTQSGPREIMCEYGPHAYECDIKGENGLEKRGEKKQKQVEPQKKEERRDTQNDSFAD